MGNSNSTTGYSRLHGSSNSSNALLLGHDNKQEEKEKLLIVKANRELNASQSPEERASINDRKSNHPRLLQTADSRRTPMSPLLQSSNKSVVAQHPILVEKKEVVDPAGIERKLDDLKLRVATLETECRLMHSSMKKQEEVIEKMKKDNEDLQKRVGEYLTLTSQVNNNRQQQQQMVFGADGNSIPDLIDLATDINPKNDSTAGREFERKNPITDCLMPPPISPAVVDPKHLPPRVLNHPVLLHDLTGCVLVLVLVFLMSMLVGLLL